ncbi:hypothetical protein IAU59_006530 [Kwoniella sp. CBS 9459]
MALPHVNPGRHNEMATPGVGGGSISTTGAHKASSSSSVLPAHAADHDHHRLHGQVSEQTSSPVDSKDACFSFEEVHGGTSSDERDAECAVEDRGRSRFRDIPAISTTAVGRESGLDVLGSICPAGDNAARSGHLEGGTGTFTPFSPFSPMGSSSGFDTPAELASPNLSNKAFHGSVITGLPYPSGMKHNDVGGFKEGVIGSSRWEEMMVKIASQAQDEGRPEKQASSESVMPSVKGTTTPAHEFPVVQVPGKDQEQAQAQAQASQISPNGLDNASDGNRAFRAKPKSVYKNGRVIAIDFDDVCSQNMAAIINEHNALYGTDLTLGDLQTYVFWQNRGWGTPADVARKVMTLNQLLPRTAPIPGFAQALSYLHFELGHPIHIITSRPPSDREALIQWLKQEGITVGPGADDVIAEAWFTGTYGDVNIDVGAKGDDQAFEDDLNERLRNIWKDAVGKRKGGLGKLKILRQINASLFIDDHHGNLEPILSATPPIPCLLFGKYGWNASRSGIASPVEMMDYEERMRAGLPLPREKISFGDGPDQNGGGGLVRTENWEDIIKWVEEWDRTAAVAAVYGDA